MAIAKMRKISLFALNSDKDALTRELLLLGCLELSVVAEDERLAAARTDVDEVSADYRLITRALDTLKKRAPSKTPFFAPAPEVSVERFLDAEAYDAAVSVAREVEDADAKIKHTESDETREAAQIESLLPWVKLDLPLDCAGTATCGVLLGSFSTQLSFAEIEGVISAEVPEAQLFALSDAGGAKYCEILYLREVEAQLGDVLRSLNFSQNAPKGVRFAAEEAIYRAKARIAERRDERAELESRLAALEPEISNLKLAQDFALTNMFTQTNAAKLRETGKVTVLSGYFPLAEEQPMRDLLDRFDCAYDITDPDESEYADVPILLKNNAVTAPLMMVTEMYSLPAYDGIDPNPLIMPFFVLFYGLMMGDIGYGLVMITLALLVKFKKKPRGGFKNFASLLLMCGIATIGGGIITASFFGDAPTQIASIFGREFSMPWTPLVDPMNQAIEVLIGALALGAVQIIAGMGINFYMSCRDGHPLDAILDNVPWWITFVGIALGALGITWFVAIGGAVFLVCTQGRGKPTLVGKIVSGLGSLYNITAYFSDILSYARVMALMLAGGVIANVFNMIGAMTGNIFAFVPIFIIGHALNIALNLLGNYVHDLRLQCLEYFGKFYKDGGRKFEPLEIRSKNYVITK